MGNYSNPVEASLPECPSSLLRFPPGSVEVLDADEEVGALPFHYEKD